MFILPKVLLRDVNGEELAFGKYRPESIVMPEGQQQLTKEERDFLYGFAVWIYRAIVVYKNDTTNDTTIVYQKKITQAGRGSRRQSNTFLVYRVQIHRAAILNDCRSCAYGACPIYLVISSMEVFQYEKEETLVVLIELQQCEQYVRNVLLCRRLPRPAWVIFF